jgi:hypothetical protein
MSFHVMTSIMTHGKSGQIIFNIVKTADTCGFFLYNTLYFSYLIDKVKIEPQLFITKEV